MSVSSSIFISRIRNLQVLDAVGDPVGKVRDVVVQPRPGGRPPRVKGLVVELFARRRIFVPMARVHSITADQVGIIGMIDTRRFVQRSSESLVMADLFDRSFTSRDGKEVAVFDVAMRESRVRDWELSEVALRESPKKVRFGFAPRGSTRVVSWAQVGGRLLTAEQSADLKIAELADMNPADVARELHDMAPERRAAVAQALDDEQLADAFQELPTDEQISLLSALEAERAADVLDEMDPDDAADLFKVMPEDLAEDLLGRMEPEEAEDVRTLLIYEEHTAGGLMTPEPIIISPDDTVSAAVARARSEDITPALASMVFICRPPLDTPSGRYIGAVHLQRLLREPPSIMASPMIDPNREPLPPDADLFTVSRYFATYNLVVAPVVNEAGQLVGAVTVDDVLDHMLPLDWRGEQLDAESDEEVTNG